MESGSSEWLRVACRGWRDSVCMGSGCACHGCQFPLCAVQLLCRKVDSGPCSRSDVSVSVDSADR